MNHKSRNIIESIKSGENHKALHQLYKGPLNKIRKYILNNSGTLADADDVFQDAVITLFHYVKKGKYNEEYDLDGFLFKVAKNAWIDIARKKKKLPQQEYKGYDVSDNENNHLDALIKEERMDTFHRLFNKLEDHCKKLLSYVMFDKKSLKEIAEIMGYKDTNVAKNQHYRCKKYFSKILYQNKEALKLLRE